MVAFLVAVPQIRSKRWQQLQARPRDPNASSSLLMIAPVTDCRYRYLRQSKEATRLRHSPSKLLVVSKPRDRIRTQQSQLNLSAMSRIQPPRPSWPDGSGPALGTGCSSTSEYLRQISAFAAAAFSNCSQATENLRHICEQTALLSQNPFSAALTPSYGQQAPSAARAVSAVQSFPKSKRSAKAAASADHLAATYASSSSASAQAALANNNQWPIPPPVFCACAICQKTKRAKVSAVTQRTLSDVTRIPSAQFPSIKQQLLTRQGNVAAGLANGNATRLKRAVSPDDVTYSYQPMRKMPRMRDPVVAVAKQQHNNQYDQFHCQPISNVAPSLLPFVAAPPLQQVPAETATRLSQNFFISGIPNSTTSFMTPSLDGAAPRDLIMTPSFENRLLVNSQASGPVPFGGGMLSGWSNFMQPPILNALEWKRTQLFNFICRYTRHAAKFRRQSSTVLIWAHA